MPLFSTDNRAGRVICALLKLSVPAQLQLYIDQTAHNHNEVQVNLNLGNLCIGDIISA